MGTTTRYLDASRLAMRKWDDTADAAIQALDALETAEETLDHVWRVLAATIAEAKLPAGAPLPAEVAEALRDRIEAADIEAQVSDLRRRLTELTKRLCLQSAMPGAAHYLAAAEW